MASSYPAGSTNQTWIAWDSLTGKWLFNITDVPATGTVAYTSQGEIVKYILNYNTTAKSGWLALWNWTCCKRSTSRLLVYKQGTNIRH